MPFRVSRQDRQPRLFLVVGIGLGLLLGSVFQVEDSVGLDSYSSAQDFKLSEPPDKVFIKCVIVIQGSNPKPHKFVRSVIDTYGKRCNKTIFFAPSDKIPRHFGDQAEIYHLDYGFGSSSYAVFRRISEFVQSMSVPKTNQSSTWTVFLNEQNFLMPENLRVLASQYQPDQTVVMGRVHSYHSPWAWLFPFIDYQGFFMTAGVALSEQAMAKFTSSECQPGWFTQFSVGKALLDCATRTNILIVDPIDQEGYHLFVEKNLRTLFTNAVDLSPGVSFEKTGRTAGCCSDQLISVGQVAHRDLLVMEYAVHHVRVFGH